MLIFGVLLLLCVIILGRYTYIYVKYKHRYRIIDQIPGPSIKPLFGNLLDIPTKPDDAWRKFRSYAKVYFPIYRLWASYIPAVNLLCPEDIELILSNPKHNKKGLLYRCLESWLGTGLLTSYGTKWHIRRKILTPTFHFTILQHFLAIFTEQSSLFVQKLENECNKPHTNILPLVSQFTLKTVCETALGTQLDFSREDQNEYFKAIHRMGDVTLYRFLRPWLYFQNNYKLTSTFNKEMRLIKILHNFSKTVIKARECNLNVADIHTSKNRLAMLDLLISAKHNGECIDDEGIREEVDTFTFEGHDTTAACLAFTLMMLANHKDVQDKVLQELKDVATDNNILTYTDLQNLRYLERVLKESLRMFPSVPFIGRTTGEEVKTHTGYVIPARCNINIHIFDLHYNPEIYPHPYKFDPDRFLPEHTRRRHPYAYLPFSAGSRNCIGQKFAMLELKCVISAILQKYVLEPVDKPEDIVLTTHMILKTAKGIKIKIRPRL